MRRFLLGVDLAKSLDYTSFAVVEQEQAAYHLVALDRIKGIEYPVITELILATITKLESEPELEDGPHCCLDASGLGAPIRDYLKASGKFNDAKRRIFPVVFTGGESARKDTTTGNYNISKSLIVGNFLSLMQHRRFDYAPDLRALPLLEQEIAAFKRHTSTSGRPQFDAEEGAHDDLICALCIPLIIGELVFKKMQMPVLNFGGGTKPATIIPGGVRGGGNWFTEAARHHIGGGSTLIGGTNHRSR